MRWIGPIIGTAGLYFMLVGLGLLPMPGGPQNLHAPLWVLLLVGLAFFLAGASMLIQVAGQANENGELPSGSPLWLRVMQYLMGVAIFATFGMIGSWIGLGAGPREFSGGIPFVGAAVNETIGRFAFGAGGIMCWLGALAFPVSGARKLYRRGKT